MLQIAQVTINTTNPDRLAEFWTAALGYRERSSMGPFTILANPSQPGPRLNLQQVPEPRTARNSVHLDVVADNREAEVRRLVSLGAREINTLRAGDLSWTTLADPDGNEFDVVG